MRSGLRFIDEFQKQVTYACIAAFLVAFWAGFATGTLAIVGAVWP